jgi:phosphate transport system substrate-binding protein
MFDLKIWLLLPFFFAIIGNSQAQSREIENSPIDFTRTSPENGTLAIQKTRISSSPEGPGSDVSAPSRLRGKQDKIVVITGARFSYPLVQKWIDDYNKVNPDVQIIIESRGTSDPAHYDILIEAFDPDIQVKKERKYLYIARYAILPVANSNSAFTKIYAVKGLNEALIQQLFFHDLFADKQKELVIKAPYTIYTRLQKAGAPITFTKYFGFEQKDIKGKAIAGSDEHLLKALLRDTLAVSYLPLNLIYDPASKKPISGLTVLPVDLNGNGRVSDDEKFYDDLGQVIQILEEKDLKNIHNIPIAYLHFSIDKINPNPEAFAFLSWVVNNGQGNLHDFGFLKPDPDRLEKDKAEMLTSKR